jgi:hypothetical protein
MVFPASDSSKIIDCNNKNSAAAAQLRKAAMRMLVLLERALDTDLEASFSLGHDAIIYYERLFGNKVSLVNTLVTLSDLLMKLEQWDNPACLKDTPANQEFSATQLTQADIALVEMFIKKIHSQTGAQTTVSA